MKSEFSIYLAGACKGLTVEQSDHWRRKFNKEIKESLYFTHNETDSAIQKLEIINPNDYFNYEMKTLPDEREVMNYCFYRIKHCDLVLVNLDIDSYGTFMEVQYASGYGIPTIGINTNGNVSYPWVKLQCNKICSSITEASDYIIKNYLY